MEEVGKCQKQLQQERKNKEKSEKTSIWKDGQRSKSY